MCRWTAFFEIALEQIFPLVILTPFCIDFTAYAWAHSLYFVYREQLCCCRRFGTECTRRWDGSAHGSDGRLRIRRGRRDRMPGHREHSHSCKGPWASLDSLHSQCPFDICNGPKSQLPPVGISRSSQWVFPKQLSPDHHNPHSSIF